MTTTELKKFLKFYFLIDFGFTGWNQQFVDDLELNVDEYLYLESYENVYKNVLDELVSNLFTADKSSEEIIYKNYFLSITNVLALIKNYRKFVNEYHKRDFLPNEEYIFKIYDNFLYELFKIVLERKFNVHQIINFLDTDGMNVIMDDKRLLLLFFNFSNPIITQEEIESSFPFINFKSLEFFKKLHSIFKNHDKKHADYSFIYQRLKEDCLFQTNVNHEIFIEFLNSPEFGIEINERFKTRFYAETFYKNNIYNLVKRDFFID